MGTRDGQGEFLAVLASCRKVNLDTNAFVYHLRQEPRYGPLMEVLFRMAAERRLEIVASAVVQLELLVQPMRRRLLEEAETVLELTEQHPNIRIVDVSRPVTLAAAAIRGRTRLKVPDAIVLATGAVERCGLTIGNDVDCQQASLALSNLEIMAQEALPLPLYVRLGDFAALA